VERELDAVERAHVHFTHRVDLPELFAPEDGARLREIDARSRRSGARDGGGRGVQHSSGLKQRTCPETRRRLDPRESADDRSWLVEAGPRRRRSAHRAAPRRKACAAVHVVRTTSVKLAAAPGLARERGAFVSPPMSAAQSAAAAAGAGSGASVPRG